MRVAETNIKLQELMDKKEPKPTIGFDRKVEDNEDKIL